MAKYINNPKLTDGIIEGIMNRCGLDLVRAKYDDFTGKLVPIEPITRAEDMIMVSCTNREMLKFASMMSEKVPFMKIFNTGAYALGDEIVILEDFMASRFKIIPEMDELDETLFKEYYKTMKLLFGKEYEDDAKVYFDKYLEENKTDTEEKEKTEE